ncbi:hypothetical protein HWV62_32668 [Athelia sp. TMB]|nr:hypothetical protein HWV62_32668 [Athelia sp. TMB]
MDSTGEFDGINVIVQKTLQANKVHQYALKVYTERLEAELRTIDKLLTTADVEDEDDEPELDAGGYVTVPSSERAVFPIFPNEFLSPDSPFYDDAQRRTRYVTHTASHPSMLAIVSSAAFADYPVLKVKPKELEVLAEAVRTENHRKRALEAQTGGLLTFATRDDKDFFEWNTDGIDWGRVAEKVSTAANFPRTAQDCAILWLGDRHPKFTHTPWATPEISKLQALIKATPTGTINWAQIAKDLDLLPVASHVSEDAEPRQCRARYERSLDPSIKRGSWSAEEDEKLRLAVKAYGTTSWADVAGVIPGRNNEQCRDRWQDNLNPTLAKGKWTSEEDTLLKEAVEALGTTSWKAISERMGNGRNDNNCRTRYSALAKQKNPTKVSISNESRGNTEIAPQPGPSKAAPRRNRSRKDPSEKPISGRAHSQEIEPVQPPRPRPKPRLKRVLKKAISPEPPAQAEHEEVRAMELEGAETPVVSDKGKGDEETAEALRKRKMREEVESKTAASPARKRARGTATALKRSVVEEDLLIREGLTTNIEDQVPPSASRKRDRTSGFPAPRQTSSDKSRADVPSAMNGPQCTTPTGHQAENASSAMFIAEPTRRQPSRAASKKKS